MNPRSLSVIIACYMDAGSVKAMHQRLSTVLPQLTSRYEIIFVNDCSPDNALELLREIAAADPHVTVISHSRNFGSQNAFLSGMKVCTGDGVVLMDGDLQDPPELIPQFYAKWLEGHDVVYGNRVKRKETLFRQVAYKLFYRLWRNLSYVKVPLDAGDFSLLDRRVVEHLLSFPERDVFLRGLRAFVGFRQTGVDYVRDPRFDGRTTNSFKGNLRWAAKAIASFSYKPLEWISAFAFFTTAVTLGFMVVYLGIYMTNPSAPRGFMTLLIAMLFLGSVQLLSLGILGRYLMHIFDEVKGRPRFIVDHILNDPRKKETGEEKPS